MAFKIGELDEDMKKAWQDAVKSENDKPDSYPPEKQTEYLEDYSVDDEV